ncbi:hypothetical protein HHL21_13510 [Massilia sp. RP-1-19]|uniref:PrcB C-terminal domain-containing protein n=1 Tax=Massilia polaris TaxID=2728846 RepID=A0A848HL23_9BURK|nr:protease complex subunit PrcB family protein [Massilia polaris]NML62075.1 hypothetical protein [Massilia polaris]
MRILERMIGAVPLAGVVLLSSCGGGGDGARLPDRQASPAVIVGQPAPSASTIPAELFFTRAREEVCANTRNRLFVIDGKQVFWDRAGTCADNSYAQRLYGATPDALLCEAGDSIMGPRISCSDVGARAMFDTILKNLGSADLGLGSAHTVELLSFQPEKREPVAFTQVAEDAFSGVHEAKTVVVRDEAAWSSLWAAHSNGRSPAPERPRVDFGSKMLVAVFGGQGGNGCRQVRIDKVMAGSGKVVVSFDERDLATFAVCTQAASAPMAAAAIPRSDAVVEFVNINPVQLAFRELDRSSRSLLVQPKNMVARDGAAFAALWAEHGGAMPLPQVDFTRHMVIGVFLGSRENGCHSTAIDSVVRANGKITVARTDTAPGPGVMCTLAIVHPAHIVMVERSEAPVEFTSQVKVLK